MQLYAAMRVGWFFPVFVGIGDLGGFWYVGSSYSGVQLGVRLNDTANPADSLALYVSDNPAGPARKAWSMKPLSAPPPEGGVDIVVSYGAYQEPTDFYFWLDHGEGFFPMVRDPAKLDLKGNADNPVTYDYWYHLSRDTLDAPEITEVYNPVLSAGFELVVNWALSDDDEVLDFYNVYRMSVAEGYEGNWEWVASVARGLSSCVDTGVMPGSTYRYRVSAAHSSGPHPEKLGIWNDFGGAVEATSLSRSPVITACVRRMGFLEEMPSAFAVGCPARDGDTIVVDLKLSAAGTSGGIAADELSIGQPITGSSAFYPDDSLILADSAAYLVPAVPGLNSAYYRTTFTVTSFGGCGIDSSLVSLNGIPLGYAKLNIRSPDIIISEPSRAWVGLGDFGDFGAHYQSSTCNCVYSKEYSPCYDYVAPDTLVGNSDFTFFGAHYEHGDPSGGGNPAPAQMTVSAGSVRLEFAEEQPLNGPHKMRVEVALDGIEPFRVMVIALANDNPKFSYVGWTPNPTFSGETMCATTERDGQKQFFLGVLGSKNGSSGSAVLGTAEFLVNSDDPVALTDQDFALVTADILEIGGQVLQVSPANRRTAFEAPTYRNELAQNYPNPFNPTTTIAFSLANAVDTELRIYDVRGASVRTLVKGRRDAGVHRIDWDGQTDRGQPVASGMYFYKLVAGSFTDTKKMTILK